MVGQIAAVDRWWPKANDGKISSQHQVVRTDGTPYAHKFVKGK
jgi:hypothetical protein